MLLIPQASIIPTAYSLCLSCKAIEYWWKKMHKSVTIIDPFYGVSSGSCLSSHHTFYSPINCHKAILSLIILFSWKHSPIFHFLPLILSENIASYVADSILLQTLSHSFITNLVSSHAIIWGLQRRGPWAVNSWGQPSWFIHPYIIDAQLIFFIVKMASKHT